MIEEFAHRAFAVLDSCLQNAQVGFNVSEAYIGTEARESRLMLETMAPLGLRSALCILAWPLAVRTALEIGDLAAVEELLGLLAGLPSGKVPTLLHAEERRARAKLAAAREGAVRLATR